MREKNLLRGDLGVLAGAAVLFGAAWIVARADPGIPLRPFARDGLSLSVPAGWLADPSSRDAITWRGEDALTRLELRSEPPPGATVDLAAALDLDHGQRYGQLYQRTSSETREIAGKIWLRTEYSYAFKPGPTHAPRIDHAIEYAFAARDQLYVVALHGSRSRIHELEPIVASTLRVTERP